MQKTSDFQKQCIYNCYCIMKDIISFDNIENIEYFNEKLLEIQQLKIAMPEELLEEIDTFINEHLVPVTEDPDFWKELHKPDYGTFNGKNCFEINSEESLKKVCALFFEKIHSLNEYLDAFAEKTLRPYLI